MFSFVLRSVQFQGDLEPFWEDWIRQHFAFDLPTLAPTHVVNLIQCQRVPIEAAEFQKAEPLQLVHHQVGLRRVDPLFWLGSPQAGVQLQASALVSKITLWGQGSILAECLHLAICEVLRITGLLPLHAAAASRDGQGWMFLGPSGSGKTTSLLRALHLGWSPIAEDFCLFEASSGWIYGLDRGLRMWPDSLAWLRSHVSQAPAEPQANKWFVPYTLLGQIPQSALAVGVVFLHREPRPKLPSTRLAAVALWQASGVPLSRLGQLQAARSITDLTRLELRNLGMDTNALTEQLW